MSHLKPDNQHSGRRPGPSRRICAHVSERTYMHALAIKAKDRMTFNQQVEEGLKLLAEKMQTQKPVQ